MPDMRGAVQSGREEEGRVLLCEVPRRTATGGEGGMSKIVERLVKRYPLPGVDGDEAAGLLVEVTAA